MLVCMMLKWFALILITSYLPHCVIHSSSFDRYCWVIEIITQEEKIGGLVYLLREIIPNPQGVLVFVATRHHAEFVVVRIVYISVN